MDWGPGEAAHLTVEEVADLVEPDEYWAQRVDGQFRQRLLAGEMGFDVATRARLLRARQRYSQARVVAELVVAARM